ncbi:hypothetical protein DSO57_1021706 [Entomophthora muscae]|uniref:Uncharacterized protein n=1 Tax=Entomophthora muscae TaxID=34485 RepID=A0ACC2TEF0_9FUNG|nr:hypothetical protein DSO57_1021706 [Entomophthora muscae]
MVLPTGASSPLVTLFPRAFSGPSPFVSEVPKQPKVSSPPLEEDITNALANPMVMGMSPGFRTDIYSSLELWAWEQESNPDPGSP